MSFCSKCSSKQPKCIPYDCCNLLSCRFDEPFIIIEHNCTPPALIPLPNNTNAMSATNISNVGTRLTIAVATEGTTVPLPDAQCLSRFITDVTSTTFLVPKTGRYQISYAIILDSAGLFNAGVTQNATLISTSVVTPSTETSVLSSAFIADLTAGDLITLQLSADVAGNATLQEGVGAYLNISLVG